MSKSVRIEGGDVRALLRLSHELHELPQDRATRVLRRERHRAGSPVSHEPCSVLRVRNERDALTFPVDFFSSLDYAVHEVLRVDAAADFASMTGSPNGAPVP